MHCPVQFVGTCQLMTGDLNMKSVYYNLLILLVFIVLLSSCATVTKVDKLNSNYQAKDKDCEIHFFNDNRPGKKYEVIAKIESHIQKNFFFGGKVKLDNEVYKELSLKACSLGGDAVIIDDCIQSSVSEMTHIHVWATVIKYSI